MPHIHNGNNKLSKEALDQRFRNSITTFNKHYTEWLNEMSISNVAFNALDTSKNGSNIYNQVNGTQVKKGIFDSIFQADGLNNFKGKLNAKEPDYDSFKAPSKLMALFSFVTNEIITKEIKL